MFTREETLRITVRNIHIGGGAPVTVQSMTNTDTRDVQATVAQVNALAGAGCDIVRVAVPDDEAAAALHKIRKQTDIPLVADIHFRHTLALKAIEAGVDKLRINPGNIGSAKKVEEVARAAADADIPIRVGVNAGSLERDLLASHGGPTPEALVESAAREVTVLRDMGFFDVCVSMKSSRVGDMIEAYALFAEQHDNPLHVGVTEAGTVRSGTIKSACGIGAVLSRGIGDTIRVSLTADPVEEVLAGIAILKAMGLRKAGAEVISCPTCGRTNIDIVALTAEVEQRAAAITTPITIAVMGCEVNGPGEAREADYGIAGGRGEGLVFRKGETVTKVPENRLVDTLFDLIDKDIAE